MKKVGIVLVVFVLIALVIGIVLFPRIQQWKLVNQQHDLRIAIAEAAYLDHAVQSSSTQVDAQFTAVIGSSIFDEALSGAKGLKVTLPSIGNATVQIVDTKIEFRDGFPLLNLSAHATRPDLPNTIVNATVTATLVPVIDQSNANNNLGFRIKLVDVKPEFSWTGVSVKVNGFLQELARVKASEIEDALPVLTVPLQTDLAFQLPGQSIRTRIPNPDGWIDATVQIPTMNVHWSVGVKRLLFLSDGIHVAASLGQTSQAIPTLTYSANIPSSSKAVVASLEQERKHLSDLRTKLEAQFGTEKTSTSDLSLHASPAFFSAVVDGLNSASPPLDITLGNVSEHDYIKQGGGSLGYYIELSGRNTLQANAAIRQFRASWTAPGQVAIAADFKFTASAQVVGHFKTLIGGGIGTSVPVSADKGGTISGSAHFSTDGKNWPSYELLLTGPPDMGVTLSTNVRGIGIGIPIRFNLPVGTLAKGPAPALFSQVGSLVISLPNGTKQTHQYTLSITPQSSAFDQNGFTTAAKVKLAWQ
jgi:hypothetical protein